MSIDVRQGTDEVIPNLVASYNALRGTIAIATGVAKYHKDITSAGTSFVDPKAKSQTNLQIASADSTDTPSMVALANELQTKLLTHMADAVAHKVADTTNNSALSGTAVATDAPTAQTLASALKTAYNATIASTTFHYTADASTNATTITDAPTARTALNDIKAKFNAHVTNAPAGASLNMVNP